MILRKGVQPPAIPTTNHERSIAGAMHLATIAAPIVAPLAAMLLSKSTFVRGHARRSLTETLVVQGALLVVGAVSLSYTVWSLYEHYQHGWKDFNVVALLVRFAIGWVILGLLEIVNTLQAVRMAHRAWRGFS